MLELSIKDYHSRAEISKSDLDLLLKSPAHYADKHKTPKEQTPNMLLGSVVHKLVLEPDGFTDEFIVAPECDKRTKAGREEFSKFEASCGGKTVVDNRIYQTAREITGSVNFMRQTGIFLRDGKAEVSYFSTLEDVAVRCRPDFYNESLGLIIDLKTTTSAKDSDFAKSVANFNYHIQAAFYMDILRSLGKRADKFLFIAVETKEPYYVGFYELDTEAVELGRRTYKALLERYKWCIKNGEFYGYAKFEDNEIKHIQTISLPTYKFYESVG